MEDAELIKVSRKPVKCPKCGGKVVPVLYGEPTPETGKRAKQGEFILGGCCIVEDTPMAQWECIKCEQGFYKEVPCLEL